MSIHALLQAASVHAAHVNGIANHIRTNLQNHKSVIRWCHRTSKTYQLGTTTLGTQGQPTQISTCMTYTQADERGRRPGDGTWWMKRASRSIFWTWSGHKAVMVKPLNRTSLCGLTQTAACPSCCIMLLYPTPGPPHVGQKRPPVSSTS